jgi:hypothetical protein
MLLTKNNLYKNLIFSGIFIQPVVRAGRHRQINPRIDQIRQKAQNLPFYRQFMLFHDLKI